MTAQGQSRHVEHQPSTAAIPDNRIIQVREADCKTRTAHAVEWATDLAPTIKTLQASGVTTLRGQPTRRFVKWGGQI
jgi:hypothetical protein